VPQKTAAKSSNWGTSLGSGHTGSCPFRLGQRGIQSRCERRSHFFFQDAQQTILAPSQPALVAAVPVALHDMSPVRAYLGFDFPSVWECTKVRIINIRQRNGGNALHHKELLAFSSLKSLVCIRASSVYLSVAQVDMANLNSEKSELSKMSCGLGSLDFSFVCPITNAILNENAAPGNQSRSTSCPTRMLLNQSKSTGKCGMDSAHRAVKLPRPSMQHSLQSLWRSLAPCSRCWMDFANLYLRRWTGGSPPILL
jgi:hypothetical protein